MRFTGGKENYWSGKIILSLKEIHCRNSKSHVDKSRLHIFVLERTLELCHSKWGRWTSISHPLESVRTAEPHLYSRPTNQLLHLHRGIEWCVYPWKVENMAYKTSGRQDSKNTSILYAGVPCMISVKSGFPLPSISLKKYYHFSLHISQREKLRLRKDEWSI